MRTMLHICFFICIAILPGFTQEIKTLDKAISRADHLCQKTLDQANLPGLAVAVARDGNMIWAKGYGYADIENAVPIDPMQSKFRIGSISKTLTAVGLAQLWASDKIDIDQPVDTYVHRFQQKQWPVTVRQVAQHVGGIRHYRDNEFMSARKYDDVASGLEIFLYDSLLFEPGTQYAYSSYGWNLISAVMENASGIPFLQYMEEHIFKPAGMHHTQADLADQKVRGRVAFYDHDDQGQNQRAPYVDNSYKWAGGGFLSTAEDLIKFSDAVMQHTLLSAETLDQCLIPYTLKNGQKTNYGLGWSLGTDKKGRKWIGHGGGSVGGSSMLAIFPDSGIVVVTLVNLSRAQTENLPFRIAEQFLSYYENTEG